MKPGDFSIKATLRRFMAHWSQQKIILTPLKRPKRTLEARQTTRSTWPTLCARARQDVQALWAGKPRPTGVRRGNPGKQFRLLSMRYIELLKNDVGNLLILLQQAPIIAFILLLIITTR